jgi:hypothetical protein
LYCYAEKDNVIGFVWDLVSAQRCGVKGGLDRRADGSQENLNDMIGLYAQKRSKQPLPAAMKAAYKKYGLATPEVGLYKLNSVDPPWLETACFQPLNLKCDILVSKFAFKFNLYRYTEMATEGIARPCAQCGVAESPGKKHKACACLAQGSIYCGAACQKEHWKAVHKVGLYKCVVFLQLFPATRCTTRLYKFSPVDP